MKRPKTGRHPFSVIFSILSFLIQLSVRIFCLIVIFLGIYSLADTISLYQDAGSLSRLRFRLSSQQSTETPPYSVTGSVGWLELTEAGLAAPVMQGSDNMEYLNKDPQGEFSLSGSLFLDSRNSPDFSDPYSLIYGHHMEHKLMFGALDYYLDEEFFNASPYAYLTVDTTKYRLDIFAVLECSAYEDTVFNPPDHTGLLELIKTEARYQRDVQNTGRILGMSTCQYPDTNTRTVVFAMIHEEENMDD